MKHHPKYRVHQPGHPQRDGNAKRPGSLGRDHALRIRESINGRQRKGEGPRGGCTGVSRGRRGRS